LVTSISGDRAIAEDIAQQALLKIFRRVSTFDHSKDALAWSMTIAVNEYRSHRRKSGKGAAIEYGIAAADAIDHETPETIAVRSSLQNAVRTVLGHLRPQDLEVIAAAMYDRQRPPLSPAAFRKRLQRALANTRDVWTKHYGAH
jgi:RNA polymerase sigma-70 factor (ECF subfamily)